MKPNYQTLISLLIIGVFLFSIGMLSCKKDDLKDLSANDEKEEVYDFKTNRIIQRIKRFETQLKEVKQGVFRGDSCINADSAIWNIEALFNVTYSFPEKHYVEKKIHRLSFEIEVNEDMLSLKDVNELYEDIVSSVRDEYRNDGITNDKGLMSVFVSKDVTRNGRLSVNVVAVTGRTDNHQTEIKPVLYGPFDYRCSWYYGEYGGSWDEPDLITDAAELLEDTINYYYGYKSQDKLDYRNIYVNMLYVPLKGNEYWDKNNNEYYIFYKENCTEEELYIDGNKLNHYYYNELKVINEFVPNDPKYSSVFSEDMVFMEINIDGIKTYRNNTAVFSHQNYIFYGTQCSVKQDEFENPIDLLNC